MATRDHTSKFMKLRSGHRKSSGIPTESLPQFRPGEEPPWVDVVKQVESTIRGIETSIEKLHEAHKNRLMVRFDVDDETDGVRDLEINKLTQEITKEFSQAKNLLRQVEVPNKNSSVDEQAICKNIQRTIASRLQTMSLNFRKSQKEYLSRLKAQKSGNSPIFLEEDDVEYQSAGGIQFTEGEKLLFEENQINLRERDKEIQKIADSITELATIFRELAVLVIEQGSILDRIDTNMDMVVDSTTHAVEELKKTAVIQKQQRPQKCILVLVIINFILLIILAYKHS